MKQIFDSLRENINANSVEVYSLEIIGKDRVLALVDEAEAKWEADCCEWKYNEFEEQWETSCGVLLNPNSDDREVTFYCCNCGKPIKIVEVE